MMGPEVGTEEYKKQIEQIKTVCSELTTINDIDQAILLYAYDESYSRSAIMTARQELILGLREKHSDA